jgi:hypothetical protein
MQIKPAPEPWEIEILLRLDQAWLKRQYEKMPKPDKDKGDGKR